MFPFKHQLIGRKMAYRFDHISDYRQEIIGYFNNAISFLFGACLLGFFLYLAIYFDGVIQFGKWVLGFAFVCCVLLSVIFIDNTIKHRNALGLILRRQHPDEIKSERYTVSLSLLAIWLIMTYFCATGIYKLYISTEHVLLNWTIIFCLTCIGLMTLMIASNAVIWIRDRFLLFK